MIKVLAPHVCAFLHTCMHVQCAHTHTNTHIYYIYPPHINTKNSGYQKPHSYALYLARACICLCIPHQEKQSVWRVRAALPILVE